jgi:hypothetical protein
MTMLVYLFQQRRNADLALTTDVTGRNLPSPPSSHWTFVKVLDIKSSRPPAGIADVKDVVRQLKSPGYCIFAARA